MTLPVKIDVIPNHISGWQFAGHNGSTTTVYNWNPAHGSQQRSLRPLVDTPRDHGRIRLLSRNADPQTGRLAVNLTKGLTSTRAVADAVWTRLANGTGGTQPPFEPPSGKPLLPDGQNDWKLLDAVYCGECDEQARLMVRVLGVLGVPATSYLMRASLDTADLFNVETKMINGRKAYLVMDFDMGTGYDWNNFEGVCNAGNHWYAVWPGYQADTALDLFRAISFQQYWVYTQENKEPGSRRSDGGIAGFESLADPNPVAKP